MKKINLGIIGAGRVAGHHLKALKENNNFNVQCICDLDISKAYNYVKEYKLSYYNHYEEMLSKEKNLDLVAIITPSGMHYEHSKQILKNFKVNIIVEKPTFLRTSQVSEIYKLAKPLNVFNRNLFSSNKINTFAKK